jgi:hypothetical protein
VSFISKGQLRDELKFQPIKLAPRFQPVDISDSLEVLEGDVKTLVLELQAET